MFVGNVISTAMNLVSVNAMGQWFARFDVNRWVVSSAPLPDDVPQLDGDEPGERECEGAVVRAL